MFRPAGLLAATLGALTPGRIAAQTVLDRSPNLSGGWVGRTGRTALQLSPPGSFPFHCTLHPFMRGLIVVR
jgi:hypothetical protein